MIPVKRRRILNPEMMTPRQKAASAFWMGLSWGGAFSMLAAIFMIWFGWGFVGLLVSFMILALLGMTLIVPYMVLADRKWKKEFLESKRLTSDKKD